MSPVSFLRSTPLSLSLSSSFISPLHPTSIFYLCVLRKKLIMFLISQVLQSFWKEMSVTQTENWEKAEKVWGEMRERQGQREGERQKAWIAAWLRGWDFLINVLTLLCNNFLAPCLSCRLTDWHACWLASSLADGHRWRVTVYSLFRFRKDN